MSLVPITLYIFDYADYLLLTDAENDSQSSITIETFLVGVFEIGAIWIMDFPSFGLFV